MENGSSQNTICALCHESRSAKLVYKKSGFPIFRCLKCGVGFTIPGDIDLQSFYQNNYFNGRLAHGYANYEASESILRKEFRHTLKCMSKQGIRKGRLLEVGCAFGYFLLEAARFFQCEGIDISQDSVRYCQSRGLTVMQGTLENSNLPNAYYDVAVMLDVIEHLSAPWKAVRIIHDSLVAGGTLVITTGDWGSIISRLLGRYWRLMTPPQHLFFFTPRSLKYLLDKTGFEIIYFTHPWKLVPLGLILYQLSNRLGLKWGRSALLNSMGIPINLFDTTLFIAKKRL